MRRFLAGGVALLAVAALSAPYPADACIHVVVFTKDDAIADVDRAERLLTRGHASEAFRAARRARRHLEREMRQEGRDAATERIVARARRLTALAVVRLDGRAPLSAGEMRVGVARGREERALRWALAQLEGPARDNPGDLRAQLHHAEAMARVREHRERAHRVLARLAEQDLMPDPHGYAALALVTDPRRDRAGWQRALDRCEQMASEHAASICPSLSVPGA